MVQKAAPSKSAKVSAKVMACRCPHEYQDAKYGRGMRVFNPRQGTKRAGEYSCTVCGTQVKV